MFFSRFWWLLDAFVSKPENTIMILPFKMLIQSIQKIKKHNHRTRNYERSDDNVTKNNLSVFLFCKPKLPPMTSEPHQHEQKMSEFFSRNVCFRFCWLLNAFVTEARNQELIHHELFLLFGREDLWKNICQTCQTLLWCLMLGFFKAGSIPFPQNFRLFRKGNLHNIWFYSRKILVAT